MAMRSRGGGTFASSRSRVLSANSRLSRCMVSIPDNEPILTPCQPFFHLL